MQEKNQRNGYFQYSSERDSLETSLSRRGSDSMSLSSVMLPTPIGANYIEHRVSKMDTLAGVAIRYGVEVSDIKRMNGLVTDRQMFAHKSLQIPLPGRHPPSPILANGSAGSGDRSTEQIQHRHTHLDILDSFQSLKLTSKPQRVSTAMSSLQGYYGLDSLNGTVATGGSDMAVYKTSRAQYLENDSLSRTSFSDPPLGLHRKTRSMVMNGFLPGNSELFEDILIAEVGDTEAERMNEKSVRRCQKADVDSTSRAPELLLKEDSSSGFLGLTGKGLALRPKSVSRTNLAADCDSGRLNPIPMAEPFSAVDGFSGFRKSSSTSSLQDSENGSSIWSTSIWTSKPKPDFQALSTAAITRPIFDGLPKPITGRRKAALD